MLDQQTEGRQVHLSINQSSCIHICLKGYHKIFFLLINYTQTTSVTLTCRLALLFIGFYHLS